MTEKTGRKRDAPVSWRPPAALRDEFYRRVEASGLSAGAFITRAVFGAEPPRQSRRPPVEAQALAQLLASAAAIRDRLEDIRREGAGAHTLALEAACDDIAVLRTAIMRLAGRSR